MSRAIRTLASSSALANRMRGASPKGSPSTRPKTVAGLARGEALVRLGSASRDFNLKTLPLPKVPPDAEERRSQIISRSQVRYRTPIETLRALLKTRYGSADVPAEVKPSRPIEEAPVAP